MNFDFYDRATAGSAITESILSLYPKIKIYLKIKKVTLKNFENCLFLEKFFDKML